MTGAHWRSKVEVGLRIQPWMQFTGTERCGTCAWIQSDSSLNSGTVVCICLISSTLPPRLYAVEKDAMKLKAQSVSLPRHRAYSTHKACSARRFPLPPVFDLWP